jgi:hypothetical protein
MKRFDLEDAIEDPDIFPLLKIDLGILDWSVGALGEAEELEEIIEAIPGFLNSQRVEDLKKHLPDRSKFIKSLGRSLGRTLLSNSLSEQAKTRQVEICMNAANKICSYFDISMILRHLSRLHFDRAPQTIQTAEILAGWCTGSEDYVSEARREIVARILPHVRSLGTNLAWRRMSFGTTSPVVTIACYWPSFYTRFAIAPLRVCHHCHHFSDSIQSIYSMHFPDSIYSMRIPNCKANSALHGMNSCSRQRRTFPCRMLLTQTTCCRGLPL